MKYSAKAGCLFLSWTELFILFAMQFVVTNVILIQVVMADRLIFFNGLLEYINEIVFHSSDTVLRLKLRFDIQFWAEFSGWGGGGSKLILYTYIKVLFHIKNVHD